MPSNEEEVQNMYGEEDEEEEEELDVEESEEEEEDEDDEEDLNCDSPSTSSDDPNTKQSSVLATAIPLATSTVTIATTGTVPNETPPVLSDFSPDTKRQRIAEPSSSSVAIEEKKPSAFDDSRRLFQRLWTDEDEIGLLQGFLDYTIQRGPKNTSHHLDTGPFYDQIKTRLQLDFNKNQLVEKLRRLKKKYRNVMNRISSGKDFSFKSPHDQATFEISRKIWSGISAGVGEAGIEDEEGNPLNSEINNNGIDVNNSEKKIPRSRKRSPKRTLEENLSNPSNLLNCPVKSSIPNVIEETVRSCLSPLFKELLYCAINGPCNVRGLGGGMVLNPLPLNFGGNSAMNFLSGEVADEKWRKQQILELEVYSKRMELVQDQIKLALEELRSMGS